MPPNNHENLVVQTESAQISAELQTLPEQALTIRERIGQRIRNSRLGRYALIASFALTSTSLMEVAMSTPSVASDGNTTAINTGQIDFLYADGDVETIYDNQIDPNLNSGSVSPYELRGQAVGIAAVQGGYDVADSRGDVFSFGNAANYGSAGNLALNKPVVGLVTTNDGQGYWEVASDGGVFAYGDAQFYGSAASINKLNAPIVAMAATPDNKGYWEVASDGGVFAYGDAQFYGSAANLNLNQPVVGITSQQSDGYLLTGADGGVFAFGNATYAGSVPEYDAETDTVDPNQTVGLLEDKYGAGYTEYDDSANTFVFAPKLYGQEQQPPFAAPAAEHIVSATIGEDPLVG
jgi:hypothetical protein